MFWRKAKISPLRRLVRDREQLASLSPGGSDQRPIHVAAASVVEVKIRNLGCPQCDAQYKVKDHRAHASGLREVDVSCQQCGTPRTLWFRLDSVDAN